MWVCTKFTYLLRVQTPEPPPPRVSFNWSIGSLGFSGLEAPRWLMCRQDWELPLPIQSPVETGTSWSCWRWHYPLESLSPLGPESTLVPRDDSQASPMASPNSITQAQRVDSYIEPTFFLLSVGTVSLEWEYSQFCYNACSEIMNLFQHIDILRNNTDILGKLLIY